MTTTRGHTETAAALVRLAHLVQYVFVAVGRAHELTPQQTQLLCTLHRGPIAMAELGRALHLEKSSLTGLVDRVERRGLVTRVRHARDRRSVRVVLTEQGRRLAARSHQDVTARLDSLVAGLPDTDRERLTPIIEQLVAEHAAATGCARSVAT